MTKTVKIGNRIIGGGNLILIQSMTNTKTENVEATAAQINQLTAADVISSAVQCLRWMRRKALKEIKNRCRFRSLQTFILTIVLQLQRMENGADKIRINPGNIGSTERVKAVVDVAKSATFQSV